MCENNTYGEYSPHRPDDPVKDIADARELVRDAGAVVDGQEVDAVIAAMGEAVDRARNGGGPTCSR